MTKPGETNVAEAVAPVSLDTTITPEQRHAVYYSMGRPVRVLDPENGIAYVLIREDFFSELAEQYEDVLERRDREAFAKLSRKAFNQRAKEEPYE